MNDNDILFFTDSFDAAVSALDDFGLKLREIYISFPEAKTQYIELPFSNEVIDLTELDGNVYYKQRSIRLGFDYLGDFTQWHTRMSEIASSLHGKRVKLVDTEDAAFYYQGRMALDTTKTDPVMAQVTLTGTMNPFKYELTSSAQDWLWDPFDLEVGVIRELKDLAVNGALTVTVEGTGMVAIPLITASAAMEVAFDGKTFDLSPGINKIYAIKIREGTNTLTFTGNGTVTIDYRGGWL